MTRSDCTRKGNQPCPGAFGTAPSPVPMANKPVPSSALPDPLPASFTARLVATVRCTVEHAMLDDGRAEVVQTDVAFEAHVDAGTVRVVGFPEVEAEVGTAVGRVRAVVSVDGEPEGAHDAETGHASVAAALSFDPDSFLARTSRVAMTLQTNARLADPRAAGDPLDAGNARVVLVGEGTFDGGSLDGGRLALVLDCRIERVEAR